MTGPTTISCLARLAALCPFFAFIMAAPPEPGVSTLELDEVAQQENEEQARLKKAAIAASEPSISQQQKDAQALQVQYGSLPEVVDQQPRKNEWTICGLKMKRKLWIVVAVVIILVLVAAIGGGLGAGLSSKPDDRSGPASSSTSPSPSLSLRSTSKLASVNYTDSSGTEHYWVYYQLSSKDLYRSGWNPNTEEWKPEVVSNDTGHIMQDTPLAADLAYPARRNLDIYWLGPSNIIWHGLLTSNRDWSFDEAKDSSGNTLYTAKGITSYGKECITCWDSNTTIFYDDDSLSFARSNDNDYPDWTRRVLTRVRDFPKPAKDSSLVMKPVYGSGTTAVLYINPDGQENLLQFIWNGDMWEEPTELPTSVPKNASITAFTAGFNSTDSANFTIQVLTSQPESATGGVTLTAYDGLTDTWISTPDLPAFVDVLPESPLAASQAGRVYGFVSNNGIVEIAEWVWQWESGADGVFEKVEGVVQTPVSG